MPYSYSPLMQQMLFALWRNRCLYCGRQFRYTELTREHIIPKSQGGSNEWENIAPACKTCNNSRKSLDLGSLRTSHYQQLAAAFAKAAAAMDEYASEIYHGSTVRLYQEREISGPAEFELMRAISDNASA